MHHVMTTPEIMQLILSSGVGRSTILNVALTCRSWKDPALDLLWRNLDSVFPLLWVLYPLRARASGSARTVWIVNAPYLLPEDWDRFEMYSRRVHTLIFDLSPTNGNSFDLTTFQMIAQSRPPGGDLLPNLRKFAYDARQAPLSDTLSSFLVFLGSSVVDLELRGISQATTPSILAYVARRVPQLQKLKIGGDRSSEIDSSALATCLIRLEELTSLSTSSIHLTPTLWDVIAQHQCLTFVSFAAPPWGHSLATMNFQPRAFTKLGTLVIRENFDFLCRLFEAQDVLPRITRVVFEGGSMGEGRKEFHQLCELLPQKLPNLSFIWLDCHSNAVQEDGPLEFDDFRSLLQCKSLRVFHLAHSCGVALTVDEFAQLLDAWPSIIKLDLQYALHNLAATEARLDIKWTHPTLPLTVLDIVAKKTSKVQQLSLILDGTAPLDSTTRLSQYQFECLNQLDVSLSTVSHPAAVTGYLARRSRKRFSLTFGLPQNFQGITRARLEEEKNKWDQIAENLRALYDQEERLSGEFRMQMQEERARNMQELREVVELSLLSQTK